jgi:hypothetical protein
MYIDEKSSCIKAMDSIQSQPLLADYDKIRKPSVCYLNPQCKK